MALLAKFQNAACNACNVSIKNAYKCSNTLPGDCIRYVRKPEFSFKLRKSLIDFHRKELANGIINFFVSVPSVSEQRPPSKWLHLRSHFARDV